LQSTASISEANREIMDQLNSCTAKVKFNKEDTIIEGTMEKSAGDTRSENTSDDQGQEIIKEAGNTALEGTHAYLFIFFFKLLIIQVPYKNKYWQI